MVGAVPGGAVAVAVAIVPGEQALERLDEVGLRPAARLHDRDARGGVGDEHVEQAVAARLAGESRRLVGDVDDPAPRGVDAEIAAEHLSRASGSPAPPRERRAGGR